MAKSAEAFRTISEVADWLGSPAHVLRFWESKFSQVKPVKRAGGRRYYRPADMLLLGGIKKLLHDDGMTIKGVQKILREQGVKHVSELSAPLEDDTLAADAIEGRAAAPPKPESAPADGAQVLQFQRDESDETPESAGAEAASARAEPGAPASGPAEGTPASDTTVLEDFATPEDAAQTEEAAPESAAAEPEPDEAQTAVAASDENRLTDIPAFLHRSAPEAEPAAPQAEAETPPPPRPAKIDVPPDPADEEIDAPPGLLATLAARRGRPLPAAARAAALAQRDKLGALLARQHGAR